MILVIAHQALWALVHDPAPVIGWVAVFLDRHQYEIPGTAGWLGVADCDADQILANLLDHDQLPTDLFGRQPPVPTVHPYALEDPQSSYLHCPACEHIAPGEDADYALIGHGRADLAEPVIVTCSVCGYRTDARPYAIIRTHPHRCPRCGGTTPAPWPASCVACQCCGMWFSPHAEADLQRAVHTRLTSIERSEDFAAITDERARATVRPPRSQRRGDHGGEENCPGAATVRTASSGAYAVKTTPHRRRGKRVDPARLPALPELLGTDRFSTYVAATGGDRARAVRLYSWNIEVSAALWGPFHILEISLRNALHHRLADRAGRDDWWRGDIVPLRGDHPQRMREAVSVASRNHGATTTTGHVVAELSLGFWIGLLANRYHQSLWIPTLRRAFPQFHGRRSRLHAHLERLRKLRNRTAHHEPVFARNLTTDHDLVLDILGYLEPQARTWAATHSRVPDVIARRGPTIHGLRPTAF